MADIFKNWFKNGSRGWKVSFYVTQSVSILLILVSFFIPPAGVIDSSVFAGIGELAFFPTLYSFTMIIMSGRKASLTKGETTFTVNDSIEQQ